MEHEIFEQGTGPESRMVTVLFPATREEYDQGMASGYQVATTDRQRREWGLEPTEDLPLLTPERFMSLLFAEPGDPALDEFDKDIDSESDEEREAREAQEHQEYLERHQGEAKLDATVTVDPGARLRRRGAGDVPPSGGASGTASAPAAASAG